ncbi:type III secretion system needle length determinant [Photorhabdus cinerea]|uniref:Type III secretion system needle length determinant n=1 Tax=Photorhabdus cinerea TaxID=471575 RepID=A0A7X5QAM1_9GAMM|nr:type III secretion system needle length determinant [Photorhabdus cinerea]NHB90835.1 type III secretion system needle length determinant [Photorhabdus cinerea]
MNPLTAIGKGVSSLPESSVAADADLQRRFELAITSHTHQPIPPRSEQSLNDTKTNNRTANLHSTDDSNEELSSFDSMPLTTNDSGIHSFPQPHHSISPVSHNNREESQASPNQREILPTFVSPPAETIIEHKQRNTIAVQKDANGEPAYYPVTKTTPNIFATQPDTQQTALQPLLNRDAPTPSQGGDINSSYWEAELDQKENLSASVHHLNEIAIEIKQSLTHKWTGSLAIPDLPTRQTNQNTQPISDLEPVDITSTITSYPDTAAIPVREDPNNKPTDYPATQTTPDISTRPDTQQRVIPRQQADLTLPIPIYHPNELGIAESKLLNELEMPPLSASKPTESDTQSSYPNESDGKGLFLPQTQLLPGERILATMQAASATSPLLAALIDKLGIEISIELTRHPHPTTLHLTLPNLGALEIQLTNENGKLQIEILANPTAQQLMKQARFELLERLQLLYPTQTIELSLPSQTDSEHGSRQRRNIYEEWEDDV